MGATLSFVMQWGSPMTSSSGSTHTELPNVRAIPQASSDESALEERVRMEVYENPSRNTPCVSNLSSDVRRDGETHP